MTFVAERPAGLVYAPDFLCLEEERALLDVLGALEFQPIEMRGQVARRTALHFGMGYDYDNPGRSGAGEPFPDWLLPVRSRVAVLAGAEGDEFVEGLVQRYSPEPTIGWHRDAPMFGKVVGVSLGAPSRMRFRQPRGDRRDVFELTLEPRSAYVLAGASRWQCQHSIPAVKEERYSITFRTLRTARDPASAESGSVPSSSPG
jgi:DNA oxidative demethylase